MPDLKQTALQMFRHTLAAIDIPAIMLRKLAREGSHIRVGGATIDLASFERICAVAIGKASVATAQADWRKCSHQPSAPMASWSPRLSQKVRLRDFVPSSPDIQFRMRAALLPATRFWICSQRRMNGR